MIDAVAALFAPLVLWLLWRMQSLSVDQGLRRGMYKLLRYQRRTYNVVSWMGVFLHELSHAIFLVLGGHGIRKFKVNVDSGHVVPTQIRKGTYGLLTFLAAAMAPMFVAPAVLFGVAWLLEPGLLAAADAGPGVRAGWGVILATVTTFPLALLRSLVGLDVTTWQGGLLFGLFVFAMPSARPSYVAKKGARDEGDIAAVRAKIRRHPVTMAGFFVVLVASYGAVWWKPAVYWLPWQVVWAVAMTAIVFAIMAGLMWYGVAWVGRLKWWVLWIPFALVVAAQIGGRIVGRPLWMVNAATLALFVGSAWLLGRARRRF